MKKIVILSMIALSLLLVSCYEDTYIGSGNIISEFRELPEFSKVSLEGVYRVNIKQGSFQELEIVTDDNIIHRVNTRVADNKLFVDMKTGQYNRMSIEVNITLPSIEGVSFEGAGKVNLTDFMDLEALALRNVGSGDFELKSGSSHRLDWRNEGSGSLDSEEFEAAVIEIENIGSGNTTVRCTDRLKAKLEGSGNVYYYGNPVLDLIIKGSAVAIKIGD
jgi:hypothetical protein